SSIVEPFGAPTPFEGPLSPTFLAGKGTYEVLGAGGGNITFLHWPAGAPAGDFRFEATVLHVTHGAASAPAPDGQYGRRDSPQIARDPRSFGQAEVTRSA
ncbi:MAG: hypothetical protein LC620_06290, partial [Halobacteriales archaeon]|nr:hypothetical protein [Halobacteriales archaeon]